MLNFTTPLGIGPLGVLVFFTMIYILSYGLFFYLEKMFLRISGKGKELTSRHYIYVAITAFAPVMVLLTKSFGVNLLFGISASVAFVFLACFLASKRF